MIYRYNGKIIGTLENGKLIKSGKQAVLFRAMDGFGLPQDLVSKDAAATSTKAARQGRENPTIQEIEIRHHDRVYAARISDFLDHGIPYHRPPYEAQYILSRRYFTVRDTKQLTLV